MFLFQKDEAKSAGDSMRETNHSSNQGVKVATQKETSGCDDNMNEEESSEQTTWLVRDTTTTAEHKDSQSFNDAEEYQQLKDENEDNAGPPSFPRDSSSIGSSDQSFRSQSKKNTTTTEGWETIWERFTTHTDTASSRQLLRQWISLPTIAVLGDTSCGKSSLLSQLAGCLELPSSHEITTKCPTELQMRFSTHRSATIDIHWTGGSQKNKKTRARLWDQRVLRTPEEWQEIPNILMQAQQVILKQQTKGNTKEDTHISSTVASDIISIVLTGPMYPKQQTLTLVDLPGLVQGRHNALTESATVSQEILQVLEPYLENQNCLIVTVLPANQDYHNAHALKLASQYDPHCQRTCLVWTKVDLIDKGAESAVAEWLQQAPEILGCSHVHMVKCRGQAALQNSKGTPLDTALQEEEAFFAQTAPWNDLDPSLFGTSNLRKKLCQLQARRVKETLPAVLKDAKRQLVQTARQLQAMGGKPLSSAGERRQYYQNTCQKLLSHLQTSLSGKGGTNAWKANDMNNSNSLLFSNSPVSLPPPPPPGAPKNVGVSKQSAANKLHKACHVFTDQINKGSLATVRSVVEGAQVLVTSARGIVRGEVVHIDTEENFCCVDSYQTEDKKINAAEAALCDSILFEFTGQPFSSNTNATADGVEMSSAMDENDVWSDGNSVYIARAGGLYDALRKVPLDCVWTDPTSWLQAHMEQFRTDDLPVFLNVESFSSIVREFMQEDWKPACLQLMDSMQTILQDSLQEALAHSLSPTNRSSGNSSLEEASIRYPGLRQLFQRLLRQVRDSLCAEAAREIQSHLAMEAHPFSQEEEMFAKMQEARYARLKRQLEVSLLSALEGNDSQPNDYPSRPHGSIGNSNGAMTKALAANRAAAKVDTVQNILDDVFSRQEKLSVAEHNAFEMELVLEAYGSVATRRVAERTPMVCWHVFRSFGNLLSGELAAVTDHVLNASMAENPNFAQEFEELTSKYDNLQDAIRVLEAI